MAILAGLARELKRRLLLARARLWIALHPRAARKIREERAWIFGGSVGLIYSDNCAALHQFVRAVRPERKVYWAIDRDSPDVAAAQAQGPVLYRDSLEFQVRALLAAVHVVSHGVHDIPGLVSRHCRALRVRLGHGVTATRARRRHAISTVESWNQLFDLVPVSSEFEKQNKMSWGIAEDRIVVTGVPRFDTLLARQRQVASDPRRLLYMPTWRDGTVESLKVFAASDYARGVGAFLNSERLEQALDRHDAYLHVAFHPIARSFAMKLFGRLSNPRIIVDQASDPQPIFAEVSGLITDYSSVAWDFLYLDKPIFFYQFDRGTFDEERGTHIGGEADWPGPVVSSADELADLVDGFFSGSGFGEATAANVEHWKRVVFPHRDDRNCERVMQEIEKRLS